MIISKKKLLTGLLVLCLVPSFAFAQQEDEVDSSCLDLQTPLLKLGSRDSTTSGEVTELQDFLIDGGYLGGSTTGYYGLKTVAAVKKYQSFKKIKPTGSVGVLTRGMIKTDSCDGSSTPDSVSYTPPVNVNTATNTNTPTNTVNTTVETKPAVSKVENTQPVSTNTAPTKEGMPKPPINVRFPMITALDNDAAISSQKVVKNVCWTNISTNPKLLVLKGWTKESSGQDKEFMTQTVQSNYPVWFSKDVCTGIVLPLNGKTVYFTIDATNDVGTVRSEPSNYVLAEITLGESPVIDLPATATIVPVSGTSYDGAGLYWSVTQADYCELYKGSSATGEVVKKTTYSDSQKYTTQSDAYMYSGLAAGQSFSYTLSCVNTKTKDTTTKTSNIIVK
jgi:peptidoglycan hydrolase-like protein with peptidoglycan-binding domain